MADEFDQRTQAIIEQYFGIPPKEQFSLAGSLQLVRIEGGDWLFHQGDEADSLYLLVRGRLQVWLEKDHHGPLAEPSLIGRVTPGDSVGELALLTGASRSAGIRAVRDSSLLRIDRTTFDQQASKHPKLLMKLAERAATLAQKPPVSGAGPTRNLSTIALLPLESGPAVEAFCRQLADSLEAHGRIHWLDYPSLQKHKAPAAHLPETGVLPDLLPQELVNWVHHLEDDTRMLVFQCEPSTSNWTRFCLRQSDLVVVVTTADANPDCRDWELALDLHQSDATARRMLVVLQDQHSSEFLGTARWYENRQLDFHLHVRQGVESDVARLARVLLGKATGLVLGAGASRGFAHLGVIKALEEAGKPIDWIGGTSIGGIMGATAAMGWPAEKCIDILRHAFVRGKPFSDFTVPLVSLLSGGRMQKLLRDHANLQIEDMPIPFFCISSALDDGSVNIHKHGLLARALQATASMPGILPPTVVNGRLAVDGAVLDGLPVDVMWRQAVGEVIAVNLAAHRQVDVDYEDTPTAWAVLRGRILPFARRYRVPDMMTVVLKATELATLSNVRAQGSRASLLIEPDVKRFGLTQVNAFDQIVTAGYDSAVEALGKL